MRNNPHCDKLDLPFPSHPRTEFILFLDEKATKRSAVVTPAFSTLANKEYTTTILTNTDYEISNDELLSTIDNIANKEI
ncbi:hypothetical protein J2Z40_003724 [Cytobacillus eiseniae]|uniref:Uncharacterized protein n=1 Tax=Cytobacillus eiseniae TaxID=762947 RepID=A0ABS4RJR2_9BACI|nr:hypothetical protein [Cytobacillus eiseniae]